MSDTTVSGDELSAEEAAYFESGGETAPPAPAAKEAPEADEPADEGEAAEEAVDTEAAAPDDPKRSKMVPHQALHEERTKRKALEERARTLEQENLVAKTRLEMLLGNKPAEQKAEPDAPAAPPDPDEDIFAAQKYDRDRLDRIEAERKSEVERQRVEGLKNQVKEAYAAKAQEFATATPDFKDAYQHLMDSWHRELELRGIDNPAQRQAIIHNEELVIAANLLRAGKNPAEAAYAMAQARGYRKAEAAKAETDADKVDALAKTQSAHKSLSSAGAAPAGAMTVERLLAMSDDDFAEYATKNTKTVERLMGKQ